MDAFCGSPLWDASLTWYTETPDLSRCFQETVLLWAPCLFLWVASVLDITAFKRSQQPPLPWTFLNITKVLLSLILILVSLVEVLQALVRYVEGSFLLPVEYCSPLVRMVTFDRRSIWDDQMEWRFATIVIYCPVLMAQFLLSYLADTRKTTSTKIAPQNHCPERNASLLSKLFFSWFNRALVSPKCDADGRRPVVSMVGIMTPLFSTFWLELTLVALLKLVSSLLTFVNPLILDMLISFVSSNSPLWRGLLFILTIFFLAMLEYVLNDQYDYHLCVISMRMRSAMINAIYKKTLVLSSVARGLYTTGEIVNLMSVDTQKVMNYIEIFNLLWVTPLLICVSIWLLWGQLGIATLGGIVVMFILLPINGVVTANVKKYQVLLMKDKDRRLKLMNEILAGIKVLKLYAWEKSFQQRVQAIRDEEMKSLRAQAYLSSLVSFVFHSVLFLIAIVSFGVFIAIDTTNVLDANKVVVSLSLFNILRVPMGFLPRLITFTAMFFVSLGRINK